MNVLRPGQVASREASWVRVFNAMSWALALASPFVLYFAITYARIEDAAALLLGFALLKAIPAFLGAKRDQRMAALRLPAVAVVSATVGVVSRDPRALLLLPSASQLAFAAVFLSSLRGMPLVEHFARMKAPALNKAQIRYCRTVTIIWGVTLCFAAAIGLVLAFWAPLAVWAAFTGIGSYVLIAVLFSGELVVRKIRFREYGSGPLDRLMATFIPPRATTKDLSIESRGDNRARVTIPPEYLFFRGHFDGLPILPGVAQLTEILMAIVRERHPDCGPVKSIRRLRFRRPILPGETIDIEFDIERAADPAKGPLKEVRFEMTTGTARVAGGTLSWEP